MHTGGRTHYLALYKLTINGARVRQWLAIEWPSLQIVTDWLTTIMDRHLLWLSRPTIVPSRLHAAQPRYTVSILLILRLVPLFTTLYGHQTITIERSYWAPKRLRFNFRSCCKVIGYLDILVMQHLVWTVVRAADTPYCPRGLIVCSMLLRLLHFKLYFIGLHSSRACSSFSSAL